MHNETEFRHTCLACGAAYWDFDLPRGGDNTVSDGTAIAYCDACGEIDNFKIDEVEYADN